MNSVPYYLTEEQKSKKGLKLHLGCSNIYLNHWINVDLGNPTADVQMNVMDLDFDDNSADLIIASHIIEHFDDTQIQGVINEWYRVLNKDGWLIIECPDFQACLETLLAIPKDNINERLINMPQLFGRPDWHELQIHRSGIWAERLIHHCKEAGFTKWEKAIPRQDGLHPVCMRYDFKKC